MLLVALLAVLWLATSLRSAAAERDALPSALAPGRISAEELRRDEELVARARTLNPTPLPDLLRAQLLRREGRSREAVRVLNGVVMREPENAGAWATLAALAAPVDPDRAREARRRLRELAPPAL